MRRLSARPGSVASTRSIRSNLHTLAPGSSFPTQSPAGRDFKPEILLHCRRKAWYGSGTPTSRQASTAEVLASFLPRRLLDTYLLRRFALFLQRLSKRLFLFAGIADTRYSSPVCGSSLLNRGCMTASSLTGKCFGINDPTLLTALLLRTAVFVFARATCPTPLVPRASACPAQISLATRRTIERCCAHRVLAVWRCEDSNPLSSLVCLIRSLPFTAHILLLPCLTYFVSAHASFRQDQGKPNRRSGKRSAVGFVSESARSHAAYEINLGTSITGLDLPSCHKIDKRHPEIPADWHLSVLRLLGRRLIVSTRESFERRAPS